MEIPILPSRITAVTVFTSGALITRNVHLDGLSGQPAQVRVSGLPLCLDDASLRVRITGGNVVATDAALTWELPVGEHQLPPAVAPELIAARSVEAAAAADLGACQAAIERLGNLTVAKRPKGPRGTPPASTPASARLALLTFRQEEATRLGAERERLRERLRGATEYRSHLEAGANAASNARQARSHQVRSSVLISLSWSGPAAGATLMLDYLVPGASWVPHYAMRFDRSLATGTIALRGSIIQCTGEDWSGVDVTLSTAQALAWYDLPEMGSLRIGRRQPASPRSGWRAAPAGAEALYLDYDAARALVPASEPPQPESALEHRQTVDSELDSGRPGSSATTSDADEGTRMRRSGRPSQARPAPSAGAAPGGPPMTVPSAAPMGRMDAALVMKKSRQTVHQSSTTDSFEDNLTTSDGTAGFGSGDADDLGGTSPMADRPTPNLLAYRRLRMPPPDSSDRGRLVHATALPPGMMVHQDITISVSITQSVQWATDLAVSAAQASLPRGTRAPVTAQFAYSYPPAADVHVPSDGIWHTVTVAERTTTASLTHVVVPRESRDVFRVVEILNPFPVPLLAGPADVTVAGDYLMTVDLGETVVGGRHELGLGVEQGITVARNTTYEEVSAGMLGGSLALNHGISITVANKLQVPVAIEVRERIPVPATGVDECKVKLDAVTPAWEEFAPSHPHLEGGHRWKVIMQPSAVQTLVARYTIVIPAKSEINGGNRRES